MWAPRRGLAPQGRHGPSKSTPRSTVPLGGRPEAIAARNSPEPAQSASTGPSLMTVCDPTTGSHWSIEGPRLATGGAGNGGPGRIWDRLAEVLVVGSPAVGEWCIRRSPGCSAYGQIFNIRKCLL